MNYSFISQLGSIDMLFEKMAVKTYDEWKEEPSVPLNVLVSAMADALKDGIGSLDNNKLELIFQLVESVLSTGDKPLQDAVATSFLENLQNYSSAGEFKFSLINKYLGEQSRSYCLSWDEFTGVKTEGLY